MGATVLDHDAGRGLALVDGGSLKSPWPILANHILHPFALFGREMFCSRSWQLSLYLSRQKECPRYQGLAQELDDKNHVPWQLWGRPHHRAGKTSFDMVVGRWPFVKQLFAQRGSIHKGRGTIDIEVPNFIDGLCRYLIDEKVIPGVQSVMWYAEAISILYLDGGLCSLSKVDPRWNVPWAELRWVQHHVSAATIEPALSERARIWFLSLVVY